MLLTAHVNNLTVPLINQSVVSIVKYGYKFINIDKKNQDFFEYFLKLLFFNML